MSNEEFWRTFLFRLVPVMLLGVAIILIAVPSGADGVTDDGFPGKAPKRYIVAPETWHGCKDGECFEVRFVHNDATQFLEPGPCPEINPCKSEGETNVDF